MNVLLDTNVILDTFQERIPFSKSAKNIFRLLEQNKIKCCLTANAVADIFYLTNKASGFKMAKSSLIFILTKFEIIAVTHEDCNKAFALPIRDFEDALVLICAEKSKVDYVVTRDEELLNADFPIPIYSPQDFLEIMNIL
jgi:predicted nucleic acid-binding protein